MTSKQERFMQALIQEKSALLKKVETPIIDKPVIEFDKNKSRMSRMYKDID